jgi:hypothetical protein
MISFARFAFLVAMFMKMSSSQTGPTSVSDSYRLVAPVLRVIEAHENKCLDPEYRG